MKHKQDGSVHVIIISILIVVIGAALTIALLGNMEKPQPVSPVSKNTSESKKNEAQTYVEFEDWRVRFTSDTTYNLKLNSNQTTYFISSSELAETCSTPDTPWLGMITRFDNPEEKQTIGPDAGKTMKQIFGKHGKMIDGKLYYYDTTTEFCTRGTSNPKIEKAAEILESEIKSLEAY